MTPMAPAGIDLKLARQQADMNTTGLLSTSFHVSNPAADLLYTRNKGFVLISNYYLFDQRSRKVMSFELSQQL